jgi:hypothetical protein
MNKSGGSAPSPDPQIGAAALKGAETGEEWLAFAKTAFDKSSKRQEGLDTLTNKVITQQLGIADQSQKWATEDRARWTDKAKPIEDKFFADAKVAGNKQQQEDRAAEAVAGVSTASAQARETAQREASSLGIRPDSGRSTNAARAGELGTALASAGAATGARAQERARGDAMRGAAIDLGNTALGRSSANLGTTLAAGSSAVGLGANNQQISMMPAQNMNPAFSGAQAGQFNRANVLNNTYGIQMQGWAQEQQTKNAGMADLASGLGSIAGIVAMSDPAVKKNIKPVKKGDGLKAIKKMPVSKFDYKPGAGDGGKGHTGTMSTHYAKATGQKDNGTINLQDAIGITMKAVQDLDHKVSTLHKSMGGKKHKKSTERRMAA